MSNTISISSRIADGQRRREQNDNAAEAEKIGYLRGGNSGVMAENGEHGGSSHQSCVRIAHLRMLGINVRDGEEISDSNKLMFQLGHSNEDMFVADLEMSRAENEVILRESETGTRWETSNGVPVTGRPDVVIAERVSPEHDGATGYLKPILGIELKSVASFWTTRGVVFGYSAGTPAAPKLSHLAQAGHYSWQLGMLPYRLVYRQYNIYHPEGDWVLRSLPQEGAPLSQYIQYEKGKPTAVLPFQHTYELDWTSEGRLRYRVEDSGGRWVESIITVEGIRRFYETAATLGRDGRLPPRPANLSTTGKEKSSSLCKYCPLAPVCKKAEKGKWGYDEWLAEVRSSQLPAIATAS